MCEREWIPDCMDADLDFILVIRTGELLYKHKHTRVGISWDPRAHVPQMLRCCQQRRSPSLLVPTSPDCFAVCTCYSSPHKALGMGEGAIDITVTHSLGAAWVQRLCPTQVSVSPTDKAELARVLRLRARVYDIPCMIP